jgi:iron(III) transport system ATP-binding protein
LASVSIKGLTKRFGGKSPTTAIDDLDVEVEPGEFLVLLGPSGCGKTTTLRCIAGLETADAGSIAFGDRVVYDAAAGIDLPPNKRQIGMVFQSYALWPHMSVRKNIGYPLRARRTQRAQANTWIEETARIVDCSDLLDRYPSQLSGGQQQRVALARGLVARPDLVLFDEPLSNLDARLRDQVRIEIHELHEKLGFTAVYVTHDQIEALALGDRLAIMRAGKIEQLGDPERVFEQPDTEYVAGFIGMSNRLVFALRDGKWFHEGGAELVGELPFAPAPSQDVVLRTRPDDVLIAPVDAPAPPGALVLKAQIADSEFGGRTMEIVASFGDARLQSRMPAGRAGDWIRRLSPDQAALAFVNVGAGAFFDSSGSRIQTRDLASVQSA